MDPDKAETWDKIKKLREEKGYCYEDEVTLSKKTLGDKYEPLLETFYKEHIHENDEIRYVQDGSGYFDIRDKNDQWIRLEVTKGCMLIEPAGLYHRFSMDSKDYIKAGRFFIGVSVWTPHYRPQAETHPTRVAYLKSQQKQA
ncbi:PREDICTED: 1,2-dihydroxy-3-keto-5-methylthiopentene dioxygenase 3-like [Priapulus caudatus]|uniref:acireductone dioxygenase (Fe(2+)-requiring) n=1 Tax=Priapulus caudatus TaxID=37621 RepID=A0ABM1F3R4_PRICU|nr:PREDICTED: 1,2-dihydroxy-3-keto-5-methylthiopentene dioxygenase 3-like [Priapulus caudatus]